METSPVPDIKQEGDRSTATINCHGFVGIDSKLQRITMSITKLPRANLQLVEIVITSLKSTDVQLTLLLILLGVGQGLNLIPWWSRNRAHYFKASIITAINWGLSWARLSLSIVKMPLANLWLPRGCENLNWHNICKAEEVWIFQVSFRCAAYGCLR